MHSDSELIHKIQFYLNDCNKKGLFISKMKRKKCTNLVPSLQEISVSRHERIPTFFFEIKIQHSLRKKLHMEFTSVYLIKSVH